MERNETFELYLGDDVSQDQAITARNEWQDIYPDARVGWRNSNGTYSLYFSDLTIEEASKLNDYSLQNA